jgi:hypothetical protein
MRNAAITRRNELDVMRLADMTLVVTDVGQAILEREVPRTHDRHRVRNIYMAMTPTIPFESRRDLFFVGGNRHPPNMDLA